MKKLLLSFAALLVAAAVQGQNPCNIVISGDFESECLYDFKDIPYNEYPNVLVACQHSTVTYTALVDPTLTAATCTWAVTGDVTHSATGDRLTVQWGNDSWGMLAVTVTLSDGTECTTTAYVKLIEAPVIASTTVPAYTVDASGDKVIRVCKGSRVEFIDRSDAGGSDIAGYHWECTQAAPSTMPHYVVDNVTVDDAVTHRVYNNCGCFSEERYYIEVLEGEQLKLDCYGTVCEGAVVTYAAANPACEDFVWHVDGGTLIGGQGTPTPIVQWDRPRDGYGVLGLDGVRCGVEVCPAMLSVRVPIIQDGLAIEGPRSVCLSESAVYRLPLFGSTRYDWDVTPSASLESDMEHGNEMRVTFTAPGTYHINVTYRCDFLDCGPYASEELIVTVNPALGIAGHDRICAGNSCSLHTAPMVSATWQVYDMDNGNVPVGTAVTGTVYSEVFTTPGHYLVTAEHPAHCGPATFVLTVKAPPSAPAAANLSSDNLHSACPNGGICLTGTPTEPNYSLVWAPACTTATPQLYTGDSVNISYGNDVCDVWVYQYDRLLQCQSTDYYVHTVSALTPTPISPALSYTVCPNSIVSIHDKVADQRDDGMLYEWKIQDNMQHCGSVRGSHQEPDVVLLVNETNITMPYAFNVLLTRSYCGNHSTTDIVTINVSDNLASSFTIDGPTQVCKGSSASYSCCNSPTNCNALTCTFNDEGVQNVVLRCNPYDFCNNPDLYINTTLAVTVLPQPEAQISYDPVANTLTVTVTPSGGTYSYDWRYKDDYGVSSPNSIGNTNTVQPTIRGYYECYVTVQGSPCSTYAFFYYPPAEPCDPMTLSAYSYDYCSQTKRITSPLYSRPVEWEVTGGEYTIATSGTHNRVADVTVADVGTYTVCATMETLNIGDCYSGCYTFNVDFIRDFRFTSLCDRIKIVNESKYTNGSNNVYITVTNDCNNTVEYISFPVSNSYYTYIPNPAPTGVCTYTFKLTGFGTNGNIANCVLGSATIGSNTNSGNSVTISTENPYDPEPPYYTCNNTPIKLTASLSDPGASIVSSRWSFGDNSSFYVDDNSIYHTFVSQFFPHIVSVTVTDSRGCTWNSPPINITSNSDNLASGKLILGNGLFCPHITPSLQEIHFTIQSSDNHYTWASPLSGSTYQNYVSEPDVYRVNVVNNHYCQKEGATFVPFLPCPTARIYAENFNCCEGLPLQLYGSMDPATGMQYSWAINKVGGGYSEAFNTGDIVFTPPTAGTYDVTLTVTDQGSTCASTTHATVTAHSKPAAPALSFVASRCIVDAPLALTATGYSGVLHWSNGNTGPVAYYSTPGIATAYYYDPAIGCPSLEGSIQIHHQPDFDALLTGCYEKCMDFIQNYKLPVYALTPNRIDWRWYLNGGQQASGTHEPMPLFLPLIRPGTLNMEVDYQNGSCHATSPDLVISLKDTCDCDGLQIENMAVIPDFTNCEIVYTVKFDVCTDHGNPPCIKGARVLSDEHNVITTATNVLYSPGSNCANVTLTLAVTGMLPSSVLLELFDSCMRCTKQFSVDLKDDFPCEETMEATMTLDEDLSNEVAVYCSFEALLPKQCTLLAVWTEPEMVVDYYHDPVTGDLTCLGMYDRALLSQLYETDGYVCLRALLCCNDELCVYSYCVKANELVGETGRASGDSSAGGELYAPHPVGAPRDAVALAGNPTTGDVAVVGTADDIVEVLVLDMHGRHVARHEGVSLFNVATLPAGTYIVRVITQAPDATRELHYLKLVKK